MGTVASKAVNGLLVGTLIDEAWDTSLRRWAPTSSKSTATC